MRSGVEAEKPLLSSRKRIAAILAERGEEKTSAVPRVLWRAFRPEGSVKVGSMD